MNNNTLLVIVLPGDDVTQHVKEQEASQPPRQTYLGMGLRYDQSSGKILATYAGYLECLTAKDAVTFFVRRNGKRYHPYVGDRVVGIVEERVHNDCGGDVYRVHIGGPHPALLNNLHFDGSTKRNKPQLSPGMLVYARVDRLSGCEDPKLSCQLGPNDGGIPRKDWMTNEAIYGELRGGTAVHIPLALARQLLDPDNATLAELKKSIVFELCIGVNGWLWIHSTRPEYTILIQNAILNSQVMTEPQSRSMVRSLIETVNRNLEDAEND
eukprot:Nitzschia sp. Nitz4//scaffold6_size259037//204558//205361//NITZ4_001108-RA/size259037-processed-gene-0.35-mRNA-1//1//CDS//3329556995//8057//frame0